MIAKLDRVSCNASFLLASRDSGARFVAADLLNANDLMVGIMALVAQQERETISRRTTEALAAAKARGVQFNPNRSRCIEACETRQCGKRGSHPRRGHSHARESPMHCLYVSTSHHVGRN